MWKNGRMNTHALFTRADPLLLFCHTLFKSCSYIFCMLNYLKESYRNHSTLLSNILQAFCRKKEFQHSHNILITIKKIEQFYTTSNPHSIFKVLSFSSCPPNAFYMCACVLNLSANQGLCIVLGCYVFLVSFNLKWPTFLAFSFFFFHFGFFKDPRPVVLQNVPHLELSDCFPMIGFRLYICGKNSSLVTLYPSCTPSGGSWCRVISVHFNAAVYLSHWGALFPIQILGLHIRSFSFIGLCSAHMNYSEASQSFCWVVGIETHWSTVFQALCCVNLRCPFIHCKASLPNQ